MIYANTAIAVTRDVTTPVPIDIRKMDEILVYVYKCEHCGILVASYEPLACGPVECCECRKAAK
jgi:hypothetical protein